MYMKKIMKTFGAFLFLLTLSGMWACKDTWVMYDTDQKNRLYFYHKNLPIDSTILVNEVSFAFVTDETLNHRIEIRLMGLPADYDRQFEIQVLHDDTPQLDYGDVIRDVVDGVEGEDFEVLSTVVPAGSVVGYIDLKINRTAKMLDKAVSIPIVVKETDEFMAQPNNMCKVIVTDGEPACPDWWKVEWQGVVYNWYMYLGDYSAAKYRKLLELYHGIEDTNPVLFEDLVNTYGLYFDNEEAELTLGFFNKRTPTVWAKYVLIPLYEYWKENYPDAERGPGYTDKSVNALTGGWRNPIRLYR